MYKNLWIIFLAGIISSCQQQETDLISLSGTLTNPDNSQLVFLSKGDRDTIPVRADGTFLYEKESTKPLSGTLIYGRKRASLYLAPGKSLDLSVDVFNWDGTLTFKGDLRKVNNYLIDKGLVQMSWGADFMKNFRKEPADFRSARDSLQGVFIDLLDDYADRGMDLDFVEREKISLLFTRFGDLNNYPRAHQYYAQKQTVNLPDDWYVFLETMDLQDPLIIEVDQAMYFLASWINSESIRVLSQSKDSWTPEDLLEVKYQFIDDRFHVAEMKQRFKFMNLSAYLELNHPDKVADELALFYQSNPDPEEQQTMDLLVKDWERLAPGQPSPGWMMPDNESKEWTLADFSGKYLYVYFWTSWCEDCLRDFSDLNQIVNTYADRNVVFIGVNLDKDAAVWKNVLQNHKTNWLNLHGSERVGAAYKIGRVPLSILIDPQGNIVSYDAPHPSDPELTKLLSQQPDV